MDTMPVKTLNTLLRVVVDHGIPLEKALEQIGLDFNPLAVTSLHKPEVPAEAYSRLYGLLMELLQDEAFGLGQEYHAPPGTFRMMCLFIIHCPTLEQALVRSWEFHHYCDQFRDLARSRSPGPLLFLPDEERVLCLFQRSSSLEADRETVAHTNVLLMMFRFYSWLIGKELPLLEVHLRARHPASADSYEELFGCPVRFEQANSGLLVHRSLLQHPVAQNEDSLREFLRQTPHQLVKRDRPDNVDSLSRRIEQYLTRYASRKLPTAETVAAHLNMSPRTLHRKLTAEGTSFQQLKDDHRRELAIHYMNRPELTIDAIAALMGFQDNSAFYRSFKKWTGVSPGRYRNELQAGIARDD